MSKLRKFLALESTKRNLVIKAALLLFLVRVGLLLLPFRLARTLLMANSHVISTPDQVGGRDIVLSPSRIGWAVAAAGRVIPGGRSCLPQALTAEALLKWHGFPARLQIGVNRDGKEKFQAHAWVESGGTVVIGGSALTSYAPLAAFEGNSS